jgi:hypothetical protein
VRNSNRDWELCLRPEPRIIGLKFHAELLIVDPQITVAAGKDRLRHHLLRLLRHHADIGLAAPVIAKAIEAEAVVEMSEQNDIVLQPNI